MYRIVHALYDQDSSLVAKKDKYTIIWFVLWLNRGLSSSRGTMVLRNWDVNWTMHEMVLGQILSNAYRCIQNGSLGRTWKDVCFKMETASFTHLRMGIFQSFAWMCTTGCSCLYKDFNLFFIVIIFKICTQMIKVGITVGKKNKNEPGHLDDFWN